MNAAQKYKDFVESSLQGLTSSGFISMHTGKLQMLSNIVTGLQSIVNSANARDSHRELLAFMNERLSKVRAIECFCTDIPELHKFSISIFPKLVKLKLKLCPPSTVDSMIDIRHRLEYFEVENSGITDMSKIFARHVPDKIFRQFSPMVLENTDKSAIPDEYVWSRLKFLKLSNCGLSNLDASLHLFPQLDYLDLSRNQFAHIIHLNDCYSLRYLLVSHNKIRVLSNVDRVLGNIVFMDLSHNQVQSLDGLDKLYSLQALKIDSNFIDDFSEIKYLVNLPCLEKLSLIDNPIYQHPEYRMLIFNVFVSEGNFLTSNRDFPTLDGQAISEKELYKLR